MSGRARDVRFLVDSGAIYSLLPEATWRVQRLRPERKVEFTLANGRQWRRNRRAG